MTLQTVLVAPFSGARTNLSNDWTVCEYDGSVDASGNLLDTKKGNKYETHNLAPTNSPTLALSSIMKNDGTLWAGRGFVAASSQRYSRTHHANFNMFTQDHSVVALVYIPTTTPVSYSTVFGHAGGGLGASLEILNGVPKYYLGNTAVTGPASIGDNKYHVIQAVRSGNFYKIVIDGVPAVSKSAVGLGGDVNSPFYLGYISGYFEGQILYFRLDATALSDEQLEFERCALMGFGIGTHLKVPSVFTRAAHTDALNTYKNINNKLYNVMANIPRVGTDALLIEETRSNLCKYSQAFNSWDKIRVTIPTTNAASPDPNSNTACVVHESAPVVPMTAESHYVPQYGCAAPFTVGNVYTTSVYVKSINRYRVRVRTVVVIDPPYPTVEFNLNTGTITSESSATGKIEALADGWWRCSATYTAAGTNNGYPTVALLDSTGSDTFVGLEQDSIYVWGCQIEAGAHATTYCPRVTATATRAAEDFTIRPFELNTSLLLGSETWYTTFEQDVASAGTVVLGGKTFTQTGDVKHIRTPDLKHFYEFDGTGDYLSVADSTFDAAGAFSVVAVVTPASAAVTGYICSKGSTAGNRGWLLYQANNTFLLSISADGTATTAITGPAGIVAGKTSLLTISYDGNLNAYSYLDDAVPTSKPNMAGPAKASSANFFIGANDAGGSVFLGKIHYLAVHKGVVLSQAQHQALYARFKQGGILPLTMSSTSHYKKLQFSFDAKCLYATGAAGGSTRFLFQIVDRDYANPNSYNRVSFAISILGNVGCTTNSSTGTTRYRLSNSANPVDFSMWHNYSVYLDLADMTQSTVKIDGLTSYFGANDNGWTGTMDFDFKNARIHIGSGRTTGDNYYGNCYIKNLRIAIDS